MLTQVEGMIFTSRNHIDQHLRSVHLVNPHDPPVTAQEVREVGQGERHAPPGRGLDEAPVEQLAAGVGGLVGFLAHGLGDGGGGDVRIIADEVRHGP